MAATLYWPIRELTRKLHPCSTILFMSVRVLESPGHHTLLVASGSSLAKNKTNSHDRRTHQASQGHRTTGLPHRDPAQRAPLCATRAKVEYVSHSIASHHCSTHSVNTTTHNPLASNRCMAAADSGISSDGGLPGTTSASASSPSSSPQCAWTVDRGCIEVKLSSQGADG